jgi:hypothetical protein
MLKSKNLSKLLSLLLTLALLTSLFSGIGITAASAAENDAPVQPIEDVYAPDGEQNDAEIPDGDSDAEEPEIPEVPETQEIPDAPAPDGDADAEEPEITESDEPEIPNDADDAPDTEELGDSAIARPQPWPSNNNITVGGEYTIPTAFTNDIITISTADAVTLIGKGYALRNDFVGVSITYGAGNNPLNLTLENVYISSPTKNLNVINFIGPRNILNSTGVNILESQSFGNLALLHVGPKTQLTINGSTTEFPPVSDPAPGLYLYKSSLSAAVGGDYSEACGQIEFASGSVFIKGSELGAVIGGDSRDATNEPITISGGQLTVEANATGAAIGASDEGRCAGDVFITGGSTLINVDYSGSAIGCGAFGLDSHGHPLPGYPVGDLYISGGSLKTVIDQNASMFWETPYADTISNAAVTARKHYAATGTESDVAEVSVSGLTLAAGATLTAIATPDGGAASVIYSEIGLNQYDYVRSVTYTPDNWAPNTTDNTKLYLYLPTVPETGIISVSDADPATYDLYFSYKYAPDPPDASSNFTLEPITQTFTVTFNAPGATIYVNGEVATSAVVPAGGSVNFAVVPTNANLEIAGVTLNPTAAGTIIPDGGGVYTLSGVSDNVTATVSMVAGASYEVTFSGDNETVRLNGVPVTSAWVTSGDSLVFTVTPDFGYGVTTVTANGTVITPDAQGNYTLTNVSATTAIVITTAATLYNVTFAVTNATVYINGQATTTATIPVNGTLNFSAVPSTGYIVTNVTPTNGVITDLGGGNYSLNNVTEDATVTVTTAVAYTVTFSGASSSAGNMQVRVDGAATSSTPVATGSSLTFAVIADLGYTVSGVTAGGIAILPDPATGLYTLNNITADTSVVVTTAAAAGYWTSVTPSQSWAAGNGTATNPYIIEAYADYTIQQVFAKLLQDVNRGIHYDGLYFKLGSGVNLSQYNWVPIGGGRDLDIDNIPIEGANYFAGIFDGGGFTISGMNLAIPDANDGSGAYGLFGFVKGGTIQNLTVSGEVTTTASIKDVAGVVGFIDGSIINVANNANISVGGESTNTGGVVGYARYTGAVPGYIEYCVNNGKIIGRSRLGGIAGEVHGITIDQSYNIGPISSEPSVTGTAYIGGIVGYAAGAVQNSYNTGSVTAAAPTSLSVNFYVGGIAGLLNGSAVVGPVASLSDSFNTGAVSATAGPRPNVEPLYATADNSVDVVISNCVYIGTQQQDQLGATWVDGTVNLVDAATMASSAVVGGDYLSDVYYIPGNPNPTLIWQGAALVGPIYADPAATGTNPNGTVGNPYNNLADAAAAQSVARSAIYILGTLPVPAPGTTPVPEVTLNATSPVERVIREHNFTGTLIDVVSNGQVTVAGGVVDGNTDVSGITGSLFEIHNGALIVTGGSLQNNITSGNGGAVNRVGGAFALAGGTITGNTAYQGGGVYISGAGTTTITSGSVIEFNTATIDGEDDVGGGGMFMTAGTVNMTGGRISDNTSASGAGGVYMTGASFNMTGGEILRNTVPEWQRGGGVYLAQYTTFNLNGGTVGGNIATYGGGFYLGGPTTNVTNVTLNLISGEIKGNLNPGYGYGPGIFVRTSFSTATQPVVFSPSSSATLNVPDTIDFANIMITIRITATVANLLSPISLEVSAPRNNLTVAQGYGYILEPDDAEKFIYFDGSYACELDDVANVIYLVGARI